jgi:hypothetical protein
VAQGELSRWTHLATELFSLLPTLLKPEFSAGMTRPVGCATVPLGGTAAQLHDQACNSWHGALPNTDCMEVRCTAT